MNDTKHRSAIAGKDTIILELAAPRWGFAPTSEYAECYWLPVIGPSCLWLHRRLVEWGEAGMTEIDVPVLARSLGLAAGTGMNSPMVKSLARLAMFQLAGITPERVIICPRLPLLTARKLAQLPQYLIDAHEGYVQAGVPACA